jgi:AcrR family transcriptional regulator
MPHVQMARRNYIAHRDSQRQTILAAAEDLFIQKGIELVTMGDVARASRLTRATIYQYFANKQEIAWAIFENVVAVWHALYEREIRPSSGSGYEKLDRFLTVTLEHAIGFPVETRFMAQFNYLYAKEWSPSRVMDTFHRGFEGNEMFMTEIIRQGVADGSLRPDLDPDLAAAAVLNFVTGLTGRLGQMGAKVEAEYGLRTDHIFREICRIFLAGIRA